MKNLLIILLFISITSIGNNIYAQSSTNFSIQMLEGKDWYVKFVDEEYNKRDPQGIRLENNQFISFYYSNNSRREAAVPYYLSPNQDKTFITSKIGLYKSGNYIVTQDQYGFMCAKILSLTDDTLTIYCPWNRQQLTFTTKRPN